MSDKLSVNRRKFISAGWVDRGTAEHSYEVASILVQAKPERLAEVEAAICALHRCEVHSRDSKGKLVVVVDSPNDGEIGDSLSRIAMTEGVLSAALVFHAIDAG